MFSIFTRLFSSNKKKAEVAKAAQQISELKAQLISRENNSDQQLLNNSVQQTLIRPKVFGTFRDRISKFGNEIAKKILPSWFFKNEIFHASNREIPFIPFAIPAEPLIPTAEPVKISETDTNDISYSVNVNLLSRLDQNSTENNKSVIYTGDEKNVVNFPALQPSINMASINQIPVYDCTGSTTSVNADRTQIYANNNSGSINVPSSTIDTKLKSKDRRDCMNLDGLFEASEKFVLETQQNVETTVQEVGKGIENITSGIMGIFGLKPSNAPKNPIARSFVQKTQSEQIDDANQNSKNKDKGIQV